LNDDHTLTALLSQAQAGEPEAWNGAFTLIYTELKAIAARLLRKDQGTTLSPTALVNECYLRLTNGEVDVNDRIHFHALAARAMRQILINRARDRQTDKRGGRLASVTLTDGKLLNHALLENETEEIIALDQALKILELEDPQLVRIVECRVFADYSEEETAAVLGMPLRTMQRHFAHARERLTELLAT
jgi:RNA polymerase sigma factor (TIGR02999 family)